MSTAAQTVLEWDDYFKKLLTYHTIKTNVNVSNFDSGIQVPKMPPLHSSNTDTTYKHLHGTLNILKGRLGTFVKDMQTLKGAQKNLHASLPIEDQLLQLALHTELTRKKWFQALPVTLQNMAKTSYAKQNKTRNNLLQVPTRTPVNTPYIALTPHKHPSLSVKQYLGWGLQGSQHLLTGAGMVGGMAGRAAARQPAATGASALVFAIAAYGLKKWTNRKMMYTQRKLQDLKNKNGNIFYNAQEYSNAEILVKKKAEQALKRATNIIRVFMMLPSYGGVTYASKHAAVIKMLQDFQTAWPGASKTAREYISDKWTTFLMPAAERATTFAVTVKTAAEHASESSPELVQAAILLSISLLPMLFFIRCGVPRKLARVYTTLMNIREILQKRKKRLATRKYDKDLIKGQQHILKLLKQELKKSRNSNVRNDIEQAIDEQQEYLTSLE
jgi:hypothetical protein